MIDLDLSPAGLFAGFVVSTIGLSVFVYGKRAVRVPQLVGGVVMMALPCFVRGAGWTWALGAAAAGAVWAAVRLGL
jgi:hypothetical protein